MLRHTRGQLLSRGCGLLREGGRFLALLSKRSRALRGLRPLKLLCFVARLAKQCRLRLDFALGRREFARKFDTACTFLVERSTMLRRTRRQLLSCGCGLQPEGDCFLSLLSERLCGFRSLP